MAKILIADDKKEICSILEEYCVHEGYTSCIAMDGEEALRLFQSFQPDLVLLDVAMPKVDGLQVCQTIRKNSDVPIFLITSRTEEDDRVLGLDLGADDYITKPFSAKEVMARIRGALRRMHQNPERMVLKELVVDESIHSVKVKEISVQCTRREIQLLKVFVANPNRVFSRDQLLDLVWGCDSDATDRAIDTQIKRLRQKLDVVDHPGFRLKTVWGVGYQLEVKE